MNGDLKQACLAQVAAVAAIGCIVALGTGAKAANENLLEGLPDNLKSLYEGQTDTLQPSAYDSFKMPSAPWKWCHSESYQGNPWRVALTNELRRLVEVYKAAGKVSDFELSELEWRHQPADCTDPGVHRQKVLDHHPGGGLIDRPQ